MKSTHWACSACLTFVLLLAACNAPTPAPTALPKQLSPTATIRSTNAPTAIVMATATVPPTPSPFAATPIKETPTATASASAPKAPTTDYGLAPEIDTQVWLNTDSPLRLADLRGKVALIEFWTYG